MARTQPFVVSVADVCFCHWPVPADALARSVPDWLTVETAAGSAWVTAIPHTITGISAFGVDLVSPAEAVTVRTYVRGPAGQRGLYFFAVVPDASVAAAAATPVLGLPVRNGEPRRSTEDGATRRTLTLEGRRCLDVRHPTDTDEAAPPPPDSLASFLVERYRFFAEGPLGGRLQGDVGHDPWTVAGVEASVTASLLAMLDLPKPDGDPLCHVSPGTDLSVAPPRPTWLV